ncbi:glycosyl hydrolase [Actinocrispum wychmicini]|nr:glycosyl hydrolase [Actinocrispum wychmicini]
MPRVDRRTVLRAVAGAALTAGCSTGTQAPFGPTGIPTLEPSVPRTSARQPSGPSDPQASQDARKLLAWLTGLPQRDAKRVVSGQQIGPEARADYDRMFVGLARRTGHRPALIGVSYDGYWKDGIVPVLIDHWRSGGVVAMDLHLPNPFLAKVDPEAYRIDSAVSKPDLTALLADAKPSDARTRWRTNLDKLADVFEELSDAGVTVIFRPLHEANGLWFWWGHDMKTQNSASKELYRDIHDHMTKTRKLHNILWGFAPAKPWNAPRMKYYPGDDMIDIMGPTIYENTIRFGLRDQTDDISDMLAAARPMALLELGSIEPYDGSWDTAGIIETIRTRYPFLTMFNCWRSWPGVKMSLVDVSNADKLMNDPWIVSAENIDWRT